VGLFSRFDVFISYSRAQTDPVRPLVQSLESRGYRVFFDQQSIEPGSNWKHCLRSAIRQSRAMILCWSVEAQGSEYIQFELHQALALKKPLIPWLLDATPLPDMHRDLQAIVDPDSAKVADRLAQSLGWSAARRRLRAGITGLLLAAVSAGYVATRPAAPPPSWQFPGEVMDHGAPVEGMTITWLDAPSAGSVSAVTDRNGRYMLVLPGERQPNLRLLFHSAHYCEEVNAAASGERHSWTLDPAKANGC
jgi:hypothetical protein